MRYGRKALTAVLGIATVVALYVSIVTAQNPPAAGRGTTSATPPRPVATAVAGLTRIGGRPDFNGVWQANNTANWDLETHPARPLVGQQGLTANSVILAAPVVGLGTLGWVPGGIGVVEGGPIPYLPWAAARKKENLANWIDRDPEIKCFHPGVPRAMYMPYPFEIIQSGTKVMMVFEFANANRTIHLDKMDPYPNISFMGYSVGKWEGDTLVVNSDSFTDATWFDRAGNFHSDALKIVERFTPMTRDAIRYEVTIEDPQVFSRPWKISMPLYRRLEANPQLVDFRCVEMVEETMYGHLRKEPLVKRWTGNTMIVDVTRRIPEGEAVHERYISGNPPDQR
jgi:hypothetical protein